MSTLPFSSHFVTTTCRPAICALAGLVPWARRGDQADVAVALSPREACQAWMASRPAYSPWLPALGCRLMPA